SALGARELPHRPRYAAGASGCAAGSVGAPAFRRAGNPAGCDPQAGRSRGRCFGVCEVRGDRLRQRVLEQQERSGALVSTRAPLYAATAAADGLGRVSYMRNQTRIAASTTPARYVTASLS